MNEILSRIKNYINKYELDFKEVHRDNIKSFIKNKRYFISSIIVFIFLIIIWGNLISSNKKELLQNLEKSMREGNSRKISNDIVVDNKKLNKKEVEPLIKYYNLDNEKIDRVISELKSNGHSGVLEIKSNRIGIWEDFYLDVDTVDIKVNTNFKDAKVFIDNIELENSNIKRGLIPGIYTVKAQLKTEYGTIEKETEVSLMENEEVSIKLDAINLNITSNFNDSKVFINNKDTNKKVSEIESYGPIPINSDIEVHLEREFPWGVIKSDKVKLKNSSTLNIDINMVNEELTRQIDSAINKFYESVFNALNKRDYNLIVLTDEEIKRKIYEEINKKSLILKNNYEIVDLETKIENSEFKYEDNKYKAQIVVKINYSIYKKLFLTSKDNEEAMFLTNMEFIDGEWVVKEVQKFTLE